MSELENIVLDPTVPNPASESVQNLVPPKKKFPFLLYVSLILLSVVSVISIYLFLQVRQLTLEKLTPSPTPTSSPSADPTAGWQTYTNTKYSYTLKVPKDWKISSSEPGPGEIPLNDSSRGLVMYPDSFSNSASARTNITLEIDGVENLTYKNYEGWLSATETPFFDLIKSEEVDFHGVNTRLMSGSYDGYGYPAKITVRSFPSSDKKNYFSITTTEPAEENIDHNIIDQILSTFKFTDSEKSNLPKKYYLSSGKFFDTRPYPTELTSLKDTDLTGFSCSDKYTKRENNEYVFRKYGSGEGAGYEDTNLTDKPVLEYLQANGADEAVVCKTDTGRTLLSYGIFGKGGGVGSATYYGYLEGNNPSVATIPTENGPYFTCGTILAITKSNTLYVECLSGDGGFGSKSLYRVGLYKAYTSDLLLKCTTTMQDESSTPKITCGTTQ